MYHRPVKCRFRSRDEVCEAGGPRDVSVIGLGTWQFGEPGWGWGSELDQQEASRIVKRALELWVNFFDTATVYGNGRSEEILSEVLGEDRHRVVITTKVAPPLEPGRVKRSAERSLRRLNMTSVELYQFHAPDNNVPLDRTMGALRELMESGQVRQVGVNNFGLSQWRRGEAALRSPLISNQVEYHLLERRHGESVLPHAREQGRDVIAYSPLAQGLLSGKYGQNNVPQDVRAQYGIFNRQSLRRAPDIVEALRRVGEPLRRHSGPGGPCVAAQGPGGGGDPRGSQRRPTRGQRRRRRPDPVAGRALSARSGQPELGPSQLDSCMSFRAQRRI